MIDYVTIEPIRYIWWLVVIVGWFTLQRHIPIFIHKDVLGK